MIENTNHFKFHFKITVSILNKLKEKMASK